MTYHCIIQNLFCIKKKSISLLPISTKCLRSFKEGTETQNKPGHSKSYKIIFSVTSK